MNPNSSIVKSKLDEAVAHLKPLLKISNCHMVEFFTDNHWDNLVPGGLRGELDKMTLEDAVDAFWGIASGNYSGANTELKKFIDSAKANYLQVDDKVCLSMDEFKHWIEKWGGHIKPEIKVKEYMSPKKGYEVQKMSSLVSSLFDLSGSTHCVDVGGGRGQLPTVLALGYNVPGLTVDCDAVALKSGMKRDKLIQKQWHAIANRTNTNEVKFVRLDDESVQLHRYTNAYVTKNTNLCDMIRCSFPEHSNVDIKLLLTGLHTCGNLGPDSLRIFVRQLSTSALFNVPCCYHLLTEPIDGAVAWNVFDRDQVLSTDGDEGFPMSEYLRGFQLGRNARMLAAQSIDRVVGNKEMPSQTLLYRAWLQVLIKRNNPKACITEGKLKRLKNCVNFEEYLNQASAILDLNISDRSIDKINVGRDHRQLIMFYFLRLCLAQVIENVILLDRLLFLYENGCSNVFLVKLFDPVLSPRCHGVVALRK